MRISLLRASAWSREPRAMLLIGKSAHDEVRGRAAAVDVESRQFLDTFAEVPIRAVHARARAAQDLNGGGRERAACSKNRV